MLNMICQNSLQNRGYDIVDEDVVIEEHNVVDEDDISLDHGVNEDVFPDQMIPRDRS